VSLRVAVVVPDGEIWSGTARMVIAKTLDGDIGILGQHPAVLGILAEGSVVRVMDPEDSPGSGAEQGGEVRVAVSTGFLSVHDDRVSIMARQAELGSRVDPSALRAELDAAAGDAGAASDEETAEVKYSRALLRAAGDGS
jgi:F-type H+-transporting ATPase subunit epsilon